MNKEAVSMFEAIRINELEEAQQFFKASLEKSAGEGDIEGLSELADALHQAGFLDEARETYLLLKQLAPAFEEWDLFLAELAIDQNRMEEGLDILLQFGSDSELYPNALLVLADAYQTMGLYEVSEHKLREAMALMPNEPVIQYALGKLYHASGKYKPAIAVFEQLLAKETESLWNDNLLIVLADCHNAVGEFEEAVAYLEELSNDDHTSDSLFQLGFSYMQLNEFNRASHIFEELLQKDPDYLSAFLYLSKSLEENGQLQEALDAIQKGMEMDPYQAEFALTAAKMQLKLNQPEEAGVYVKRAIELDPDLAEAAELQITLLMDQERYEEVVALLAEETILSFETEWKLAQAYNFLEDYEHAAVHFDNVYRSFPDNIYFLEEYGLFLQEEGNLLKLKEVVAFALRIDPENAFFTDLSEERF